MGERSLPRRIWDGFAGQFDWSGSWRLDIAGHADRLAALARTADLDDEGRAEVERTLTGVRETAAAWPGPVDWITGRSLTAWTRLRAAEVQILMALPSDRLKGWLPYVLSVCRRFLPAQDTQLLAVETAYAALATKELLDDGDRALLGAALTESYALRNADHERTRRFRNALSGGIVVITVLMLAIIAVAMRWPESLSLCTVAADSASLKRPICPATDGTVPDSLDLPLVALLGLLGAALAVARPLANQQQQQRYSLAIPLFLLKLPIGAATAVAGLWALNSNFVPGVAEIDARPAMFFWAVVLGYGQQLLTRILDSRAAALDEPAPAATVPLPPTPVDPPSHS